MRFNPLILLLAIFLPSFIANASLASEDNKDAMQIFRLDRYFPSSERCLILPNDWQNNNFNAHLVIQNEATFRDRVSLDSSESCTAKNYPEIDWNRYTLIFARFRIPGGCGATSFAVRVTRDDTRRTYNHTAIINPGPCAGDSHAQTWLLVPKLPPGYTVEFEETQDSGFVIYEDFWQY